MEDISEDYVYVLEYLQRLEEENHYRLFVCPCCIPQRFEDEPAKSR